MASSKQLKLLLNFIGRANTLLRTRNQEVSLLWVYTVLQHLQAQDYFQHLHVRWNYNLNFTGHALLKLEYTEDSVILILNSLGLGSVDGPLPLEMTQLIHHLKPEGAITYSEQGVAPFLDLVSSRLFHFFEMAGQRESMALQLLGSLSPLGHASPFGNASPLSNPRLNLNSVPGSTLGLLPGLPLGWGSNQGAIFNQAQLSPKQVQSQGQIHGQSQAPSLTALSALFSSAPSQIEQSTVQPTAQSIGQTIAQSVEPPIAQSVEQATEGQSDGKLEPAGTAIVSKTVATAQNSKLDSARLDSSNSFNSSEHSTVAAQKLASPALGTLEDVLQLQTTNLMGMQPIGPNQSGPATVLGHIRQLGPLQAMLQALTGFTPHLTQEQVMAALPLLIGPQQKTVDALCLLLKKLLNLPVVIQPFEFAMYPLPVHMRACLRHHRCVLGHNIQLGSHYATTNRKFTVVLGPMSYEQFTHLQPGQPSEPCSHGNQIKQSNQNTPNNQCSPHPQSNLRNPLLGLCEMLLKRPLDCKVIYLIKTATLPRARLGHTLAPTPERKDSSWDGASSVSQEALLHTPARASLAHEGTSPMAGLGRGLVLRNRHTPGILALTRQRNHKQPPDTQI